MPTLLDTSALSTQARRCCAVVRRSSAGLSSIQSDSHLPPVPQGASDSINIDKKVAAIKECLA